MPATAIHLLSFVLSFSLWQKDLPISEPVSDAIVYRETFEGIRPFLEAYRVECGWWPYAVNVVNEPVFQGSKAVRFEIRKDQPLIQNGKRAEVTIIKGLPGAEMWYSFAVFFPSEGLEPDTKREVISQWYQEGTPSMSLRVRNNHLYLEAGPEPDLRKQHDIAEIRHDQWHTVVLHVIHDPGEGGRVEVWYDSKKVLSLSGGNMYKNVLPKWKIGLYKAAFKKGTSTAERRIIFFDDIRVGNSTASFEEMLPRPNER